MNTVDAQIADEAIVACKKCGQKNRLYKRANQGNHRCASCRAILSDPFARTKSRVRIGMAFALAVFIAAFTIFLFQPWTQYRWAAFKDTVPVYESFIARHPATDYAGSARERIRILRENSVWRVAKVSEDINKLRDYLRIYPDGKYTAEARTRCVALADQQWAPLAKSRSESAIRQFLKDYPETTRIEEAEKRVQQLYDDFTWVQEQNTVEAYKRYLERNPQVANRAAIETTIIDLEVAAIASGEHGVLPKAQPISSDSRSSYAEVTVENSTGYELTVRYSGPDSKKIVIPAGATNSLSLGVGTYTVAASVSAFNVRNYVGTDTMRGGGYESRFYISFGPSFETGFKKRK
ncbi:MAG: hypothetical protein ACR2NX_13940 [Chthoniobacterales bacterium]